MKILRAVTLTLGLTFGVFSMVHADGSGIDPQFTNSSLTGGGIEVPHNQQDHNHLSIETTMSPSGQYANQLFTRFEIPFDQDAAAVHRITVRFWFGRL